ncbi:hypothetical protein RDI58_001433 [Solanum bulbocastanum]|uniref:Uncharacterized protein n=1 Tax=Solanum bulbocastanum TaxID=147425 RepID=A0AAN8U524_SOLBU
MKTLFTISHMIQP